MNTLVPRFIRIHLYYELVKTYKINPTLAKAISILFASALLEMLMVNKNAILSFA